MGEEASVFGSGRRATVLALAVAAILALGGCGDDSEPDVDENSTLGPTSAEGDIETSQATLQPDGGFSTLATTQTTTRGDKDALLAAQVEILGSSDPQLRLKVDGKVEKDTQIDTTEEGGSRVALVSCACQLPTGEHEIVLEAASGGGTGKIGVRTLIVFADVDLDDSASSAVNGSALITDPVTVTAQGETLAKTPTSASGDGSLIVIGSTAAPRSGVGSENVRTEILIGGETTSELAKTTIPGGKLVAYLSDEGAGEDVEMRGFTTSGETPVAVSSIITCACGVAR